MTTTDYALTWARLRLLLLLLCTLLLSGCSSLRLGYANLDWLIPWQVDDYVSLDNAQADALDQALASHLQWHCQSELPRYSVWLATVNDSVEARTFSRAAIDERYQELLGLLIRIGQEITPSAAAILASLDDRQIATLAENLAQRNREKRLEYLQPSRDQQIQERAERFEERLQRWFGTVSAEQRQLITQWSNRRGDQNANWLDGREQWQAALMQALQERHTPGFERRLGQLLTDVDRFKSAEYRARAAEGRKQTLDLIQRLLGLSSERQLSHLSAELQGLNADFQALTCEPER